MTREQLLLEQMEKAMQDAADGVVEEAKRTHGTVVVWENGAVRHIPADELPETKKRSNERTEDRTAKD
jgi:hypothetical protein